MKFSYSPGITASLALVEKAVTFRFSKKSAWQATSKVKPPFPA